MLQLLLHLSDELVHSKPKFRAGAGQNPANWMIPRTRRARAGSATPSAAGLIRCSIVTVLS
jgi:hypothetical protein